MLDELLPYYENELTYLRRLSKEFASKYPKIASRLQMEGEVCEDPHVERLIESFSFLTARIHKKLDDEFPQITEAMLSVLYPHFLRPVPSMSVASPTRLAEGWPSGPSVARAAERASRSRPLASARTASSIG